MTELIVDYEDVKTALDYFMMNLPENGSLIQLESGCDSMYVVHKGNMMDQISPSEWFRWFVDMGGIAIQMIGGLDQRSFGMMLIQKHRHYGSEPIIRWGELGLLVKIDLKVMRMINMEGKPDTIESRQDNLLDILGYCVIGFQYMRKVAETYQ
jgi:hypothetical protein